MSYPNNYYMQNNPYMMMGQGMMNNQTTNNVLKGRPVCSLEEVKAAPIDFDGSLNIFPDISNNKIYTKQLGADGIVKLNVYDLSQIPATQPAINLDNYVTKEELTAVITQIKEAMAQTQETKAAPAPQSFNF